jgi:hypothetical protein
VCGGGRGRRRFGHHHPPPPIAQGLCAWAKHADEHRPVLATEETSNPSANSARTVHKSPSQAAKLAEQRRPGERKKEPRVFLYLESIVRNLLQRQRWSTNAAAVRDGHSPIRPRQSRGAPLLPPVPFLSSAHAALLNPPGHELEVSSPLVVRDEGRRGLPRPWRTCSRR